MDGKRFDATLRTAIYRHFADTGRSPTLATMRELTGATIEQIIDGYRRLYAKRMLVPADDFAFIRMAPPFSGVPTQHQLAVAWYANRLSADAHRPDANEIRQIFARIGLTDPFWDPRADRF